MPSATFDFSSTQAGALYECKLDAAPTFTSCNDPHTISNVPEALTAAVFADREQTVVAITEHALAMDDPWAAFVHFAEQICRLMAGDRGFTDLAARRAPTGLSDLTAPPTPTPPPPPPSPPPRSSAPPGRHCCSAS